MEFISILHIPFHQPTAATQTAPDQMIIQEGPTV